MSKILSLLAVCGLIFLTFYGAPEARAQAQHKYSTWSEVAEAMVVPLRQAEAEYAKGGCREDCRDLVNEAYFGFYEKEGFERNVKGRISGRRVSEVEYKFATIKMAILEGKAAADVSREIEILAAWLLEDAQALDAKTFGSQTASSGSSGSAESGRQARGWVSFLAALGILLREGFEAILVIAAIAAYLTRSGNQAAVKVVYWSGLAAVAVSGLAAVALQSLFSLSGQNQEILEGATMLLATAVLFCVSNWMFSKAEAEAWKNYIESKVQAAVTTGSAFALGAAAFLAVFREGAETILFYQGIINEAGDDTSMVWLGFAVGCLGLAVIFVIIRHGTMRLPLKPFFIGTSILMFIMSIAFAGGGIKELQEGDLIPVTMVDFVPTIDILGIYPTVQTLIPQIVILALSIFSIFWIRAKTKRGARGTRPGSAPPVPAA
ncbi:MAG: FTR1 family iron permease [Candidatus Adiutrix sp.]|jgi:high-affinity iron transporter|nr:FTR1 family iron permease [Candidatus Adiutrix sp.]